MYKEKHTSERKYSLIDKKTNEYLVDAKKHDIIGLCFEKFKADYIVDMDIQKLKVGDEIKVDDTLMIITKVGKNCYPSDCGLYKMDGKACRLATNVAFAK